MPMPQPCSSIPTAIEAVGSRIIEDNGLPSEISDRTLGQACVPAVPH